MGREHDFVYFDLFIPPSCDHSRPKLCLFDQRLTVTQNQISIFHCNIYNAVDLSSLQLSTLSLKSFAFDCSKNTKKITKFNFINDFFADISFHVESDDCEGSN